MTAEDIVRRLLAEGRVLEGVVGAGIWDDGFACVFCGTGRWNPAGCDDPELATEGHNEDCVWRLAVEWEQSQAGGHDR
jgi:hypothetical protein